MPGTTFPTVIENFANAAEDIDDGNVNSNDWNDLIETPVNTDLTLELERTKILVDWVWRIVLPTAQPVADHNGFGSAWKRLLSDKSNPPAFILPPDSHLSSTLKWVLNHIGHMLNHVAESSEQTDSEDAAYALGDATRSAVTIAVETGNLFLDFPAQGSPDGVAHRADAWKQFDTLGILKQLVAVDVE